MCIASFCSSLHAVQSEFSGAGGLNSCNAHHTVLELLICAAQGHLSVYGCVCTCAAHTAVSRIQHERFMNDTFMESDSWNLSERQLWRCTYEGDSYGSVFRLLAGIRNHRSKYVVPQAW